MSSSLGAFEPSPAGVDFSVATADFLGGFLSGSSSSDSSCSSLSSSSSLSSFFFFLAGGAARFGRPFEFFWGVDLGVGLRDFFCF